MVSGHELGVLHWLLPMMLLLFRHAPFALHELLPMVPESPVQAWSPLQELFPTRALASVSTQASSPWQVVSQFEFSYKQYQ